MENTENIKSKISMYQNKLNQLNNEKNNLQVQLQVNEQQQQQLTDELKKTFGTTDIDELQKIKDKILTEIEEQEQKLQGLMANSQVAPSTTPTEPLWS